jgi:hypothetical protein
MQKKVEETFSNIGSGISSAASGAGDKLKQLRHDMSPGVYEGAGSIGNKLQELAQNPKILAMLLGGTGAGLVGGYLSSRPGQDRPGEDRGARRRRILLNTLLAAGAGAATTGLGSYALDQLGTALPKQDVDPATATATGPLARGVAMGGVGAGLYKHRLLEDRTERRSLLNQIKLKMSQDPDTHADEINTIDDALRTGSNRAQRQVLRKTYDGTHGFGGLPGGAIPTSEFNRVGTTSHHLLNPHWSPARNLRAWDPRLMFADTPIGTTARRLMGTGRRQMLGSSAALLAGLAAPELISGAWNMMKPDHIV